MCLADKYRHLQRQLSAYNSAAIAFSGGVDSTLLLKVAVDAIGPDRVLALTAVAPIFPAQETEQSRSLADSLGVRQRLIDIQPLDLPEFAANHPQRCYHCKRHIYAHLLQQLDKAGQTLLLDGSNLDDQQDYRPGHAALEQLEIRSPLLEAGLTKQDVRDLSRQLDLPTWDKPPFACLATRFPYGSPITADLLQRVDRCEDWLRRNGFRLYRVRCHEQLARLEIDPADFPRMLEPALRAEMSSFFRENGFDYVTLDLQGYRSGSMNEVLR
jgi:uncharacterized protein